MTQNVTQDRYKGWLLSFDHPPIPCRQFDWSATHPDYDGADDSNDDRGLQAATRDELVAAIDAWTDDAAIDAFADKMRTKMAASRAKGREGWNDPERCSPDTLARLMYAHAEKGDPVDVANFCMMLDHYGASTSVGALDHEREIVSIICNAVADVRAAMQPFIALIDRVEGFDGWCEARNLSGERLKDSPIYVAAYLAARDPQYPSKSVSVPDASHELLPCPFCGARSPTESITRATEDLTIWSVECGACGAERASDTSAEEAQALWNTRPSPTPSTTKTGALT
ncbi:Lar family restriction alleviation protein [Sphingomonas sp. R86520]|uniref:Lar family restriction alleviation protein n=1 Tax=Sphingomonas sp. R86520 TaxID=3093859 RepID=UPI0036D2592A